MKKILAVDESQLALDIISEILADEFEVYTARSEFDMNMVLGKEPVELVIININLRTISGVKVIYRMRKSGKSYASVPVMFISAHIDAETIKEISSVAAIDLVKKPFEPLAFQKRVHLVLNKAVPPEERVDPVTGLHKRVYADKAIAECISKKESGTMFIMDFDNYSFASNNISQNCLKQIAVILKKEMPGNVVYGLMNGSSVVGYIKGETDKQLLISRADELINKITSGVMGEKVYVSVGFAALGRNGDNYADLYLSCDRALNLSRTSGKNCAFFYC